MKESFVSKRFSPQSVERIDQANAIIEEFVRQGFRLTLRQLYYQFVARGLLENTQQSYKRLGELVNHARLAGLIDWSAIEDRTRNLMGTNHQDNAGHAITRAAARFALDKWAMQEHRVEVWIEKEALVGVIEGVCTRNDIDFFACRGYVSQSEQYNAGKRFYRYMKYGQTPYHHPPGRPRPLRHRHDEG